MNGGSPFEHYPLRPGFWDEMISDGSVRPEYHHTFNALRQMNAEDLHQKDKLAAELFMSQGITFTVYSEDKGIERIFPFDILPRIIRGSEWDLIETGIRQRLQPAEQVLYPNAHEEGKVAGKQIASHVEQQLDHVHAAQAQRAHDVFDDALGDMK
jgi:uncharacterized circularly permuted ATP-grasp superfamily protein